VLDNSQIRPITAIIIIIIIVRFISFISVCQTAKSLWQANTNKYRVIQKEVYTFVIIIMNCLELGRVAYSYESQDVPGPSIDVSVVPGLYVLFVGNGMPILKPISVHAL
jgi:hypothetical protein